MTYATTMTLAEALAAKLYYSGCGFKPEDLDEIQKKINREAGMIISDAYVLLHKRFEQTEKE